MNARKMWNYNSTACFRFTVSPGSISAGSLPVYDKFAFGCAFRRRLSVVHTSVLPVDIVYVYFLTFVLGMNNS